MDSTFDDIKSKIEESNTEQGVREKTYALLEEAEAIARKYGESERADEIHQELQEIKEATISALQCVRDSTRQELNAIQGECSITEGEFEDIRDDAQDLAQIAMEQDLASDNSTPPSSRAYGRERSDTLYRRDIDTMNQTQLEEVLQITQKYYLMFENEEWIEERWEDLKNLLPGNNTLAQVGNRRDLNNLQEKILTKLHGDNFSTNRFSPDGTLKAFNKEQGNYTISKEEFESIIQNRPIEEWNSPALASYFLYLKNQGQLNINYLYNIFGPKNMVMLKSIWANTPETAIALQIIKSEGNLSLLIGDIESFDFTSFGERSREEISQLSDILAYVGEEDREKIKQETDTYIDTLYQNNDIETLRALAGEESLEDNDSLLSFLSLTARKELLSIKIQDKFENYYKAIPEIEGFFTSIVEVSKNGLGIDNQTNSLYDFSGVNELILKHNIEHPDSKLKLIDGHIDEIFSMLAASKMLLSDFKGTENNLLENIDTLLNITTLKTYQFDVKYSEDFENFLIENKEYIGKLSSSELGKFLESVRTKKLSIEFKDLYPYITETQYQDQEVLRVILTESAYQSQVLSYLPLSVYRNYELCQLINTFESLRSRLYYEVRSIDTSLLESYDFLQQPVTGKEYKDTSLEEILNLYNSQDDSSQDNLILDPGAMFDPASMMAHPSSASLSMDEFSESSTSVEDMLCGYIDEKGLNEIDLTSLGELIVAKDLSQLALKIFQHCEVQNQEHIDFIVRMIIYNPNNYIHIPVAFKTQKDILNSILNSIFPGTNTTEDENGARTERSINKEDKKILESLVLQAIFANTEQSDSLFADYLIRLGNEDKTNLLNSGLYDALILPKYTKKHTGDIQIPDSVSLQQKQALRDFFALDSRKEEFDLMKDLEKIDNAMKSEINILLQKSKVENSDTATTEIFDIIKDGYINDNTLVRLREKLVDLGLDVNQRKTFLIGLIEIQKNATNAKIDIHKQSLPKDNPELIKLKYWDKEAHKINDALLFKDFREFLNEKLSAQTETSSNTPDQIIEEFFEREQIPPRIQDGIKKLIQLNSGQFALDRFQNKVVNTDAYTLDEAIISHTLIDEELAFYTNFYREGEKINSEQSSYNPAESIPSSTRIFGGYEVQYNNGNTSIKIDNATVELSEQDKRIIDTQEEVENYVQMYKVFQDCNIDGLWRYKDDIIECLSNRFGNRINVNDGSYVDSKELIPLLQSILYTTTDSLANTSGGGNALESIKNTFIAKTENATGEVGNNSIASPGGNLIEKTFIEKFTKEDDRGWFSKEDFQKAIKHMPLK